jgi:hypothetical protein
LARRPGRRETGDGQELKAAAMHATVRCSHESALLLHPPVIGGTEEIRLPR